MRRGRPRSCFIATAPPSIAKRRKDVHTCRRSRGQCDIGILLCPVEEPIVHPLPLTIRQSQTSTATHIWRSGRGTSTWRQGSTNPRIRVDEGQRLPTLEVDIAVRHWVIEHTRTGDRNQPRSGDGVRKGPNGTAREVVVPRIPATKKDCSLPLRIPHHRVLRATIRIASIAGDDTDDS